MLEHFDGESPAQLFPFRMLHIPHLSQLKRYLEDGNHVYFEFTQGARKGTIGRLNLKAQDVDNLYEKDAGHYYRLTQHKWELSFDDRKNKVKIESTWRGKWPGVIRMNITGTNWSYETNVKEEKPIPILLDHFGQKLEIGNLVLFPAGTKGDIHTRFGYIKNITPAGTIKVDVIKTRKNHQAGDTNISPTVNASDLIVLDNNDIKDKVLMAKLTNG